jgi:hypothetical protein
MQEQMDILQIIRPLDQDARTRAYKAAQNALANWIGAAPRREQFAQQMQSEFPKWVTLTIAFAMFVVFIAAAAPSLFRLFTAGRNYFLQSISDAMQGAIAGASTFLLAEFMVIACAIAIRVLLKDKWSKRLIVIPIAFALALAFEGNRVVAKPHDLFSWLETLAPPVAVLSMSLLGERLILKSIAQRKATEDAYQVAKAQYEMQIANLERHDLWHRFYANAVVEQLRKSNRNKTAKEAFAKINNLQKLRLFQRELQADAWYLQAVEMHEQDIANQQARELAEQERLHRLQQKAIERGANGNGGGAPTGEVDNAKMEATDGLHVAYCPHCDYVTDPKESQLQAKRALAAHMKAHKQEQEVLLSTNGHAKEATFVGGE